MTMLTTDDPVLLAAACGNDCSPPSQSWLELLHFAYNISLDLFLLILLWFGIIFCLLLLLYMLYKLYNIIWPKIQYYLNTDPTNPGENKHANPK